MAYFIPAFIALLFGFIIVEIAYRKHIIDTSNERLVVSAMVVIAAFTIFPFFWNELLFFFSAVAAIAFVWFIAANIAKLFS